MDPLMAYAEVEKMGFKTLVYDYKRLKQGEAGIEFWKATATETKVFRKWLASSYVPISELNDVDAAERRRKNTLYFTAMTDECREERRQQQKCSKKKRYVPTS
jgi:hypothetical protein